MKNRETMKMPAAAAGGPSFLYSVIGQHDISCMIYFQYMRIKKMDWNINWK